MPSRTCWSFYEGLAERWGWPGAWPPISTRFERDWLKRRVAALSDQLGELLQWNCLSEELPKYAAALTAAPQLLDRLLDLEKNGPARRVQRSCGPALRPRTSFWAGLSKWGLFVAGVILWFQHLAVPSAGWTPRQEVGVAAILLGGALLVGLGTRSGEEA